MNKLRHWSYSTLSMYRKCPANVLFTKIMGMKAPQHHAAARGDEIHLKGEYFLKGAIPNVPPGYEAFKTEMKAIKKQKAKAEEFWAVDRNWNRVDDKSNKKWGVAKIDAHLLALPVLHLIDYKSGRVYDDHREQGVVYGAMGIGIYREVEEVEAEFWYLDIGTLGDSPFTFTRAELLEEQKRIGKEADKMLTDTHFKATPSKNACQWCKMRSDKKLANGTPGPCDKWKKVK